MGLLTDFIEKKVEKSHADEEDRKTRLRQFYYDRIHDNQTDPQVREQITGDYLKLLSPEAKKTAQKGLGIIGKLKQAFSQGPKQQGQPQQNQQQPQGPPQQAQTDEGTAVSGTGQAPAQAKQQFNQGPAQQPQQPDPKQQFNQGPAKPQRQLLSQAINQDSQFFKNYGQAADQRAQATEKYKSDLGRDAKIAEEQAKPHKLTPVRVQVKGQKEPVQALRNDEGKYFDVNTGEALGDIDKELPKETAAGKSGFIRSVPHSVGLKDAKSQAANGTVYKDIDGKDIDLESLPEDIGLQAMVQGDKMFWVPVTPSQKTVTVGNTVYAVNPYQVQGIGQPEGGAANLGQARTGTNSTGQTPVYNPDTKSFEMMTTNRSSTPNTPGAKPVPAPQGGAAPQGQAPQQAPGGATPAQAPSSKSMGNLIPAGQRAGVVNQSLPVQQATIQLVGDPDAGVKGLKDFANLADNKDSVKRIGTVLNMIFDGIDDATGGSHISASAGPISASTGGFGQVLSNYFGVPAKLAEQKTQMFNDQIQKLPPEEREYVNAIMNNYVSIIGLRSLNKASAAQYSSRKIEDELPAIGVKGGAYDAAGFRDKTRRLLLDIDNAYDNMPKGAVNPKLRARLKSAQAELKEPAKAPAAKGGAPKTADDYLKSIGVH